MKPVLIFQVFLKNIFCLTTMFLFGYFVVSAPSFIILLSSLINGVIGLFLSKRVDKISQVIWGEFIYFLTTLFLIMLSLIIYQFAHSNTGDDIRIFWMLIIFGAFQVGNIISVIFDFIFITIRRKK